MNTMFQKIPGMLVTYTPYIFLIVIVVGAMIAQLSECHVRSLEEIFSIGFRRRIEILG